MPQRFLRPGITNSERWNAVPFAAQSLYVRLLTLVDDYGRFDGRPAVIWAHCFSVWNLQNPQSAVTPQETAALCKQLADRNLVEFYESDGKNVLQMIQWQEKARSKSKYPDRSVNNPPRNVSNPPPPSPSVIEHRTSPPAGGSSDSEAAIPTVEEVIAFGAGYRGDMARGVPGPMPREFCIAYHEAKDKQRTWLNRIGILIDWRKEIAGNGWWRTQFSKWSGGQSSGAPKAEWETIQDSL